MLLRMVVLHLIAIIYHWINKLIVLLLLLVLLMVDVQTLHSIVVFLKPLLNAHLPNNFITLKVAGVFIS